MPLSSQLFSKLLPPLTMAVIGLAMTLLAGTQPAWIDGRIGPGLFAQGLSGGVVVLSLLWAALTVLSASARSVGDKEQRATKPLAPGLALLGGVLSFIALLPLVGLVVACAVSALITGWGAGDRTWRKLAFSSMLAGTVTFAIGATLLPPATHLWPWSVF